MLGKCLALALAFIVGCQARVVVLVDDVSVYEGQTATIPCSYETDLDDSGPPTISWFKEINGRRNRIYIFKEGDEGVTGQDSGEARALGIGPEGQLIIRNTSLQDNVEFSTLVCEVDFMAPGSNESKLNFVVATPVTTAPITEIDMDQFTANGDYQVIGKCKSGFGFPQPVIDFYRGGELIMEKKEKEGETMIEDPDLGLFGDFVDPVLTTRSNDGLTVQVSKELQVNLTGADDNAQFYCVVRSGINGETVQNVTMPRFRVQYATDSVTITSNKDPILEGDVVTLTCTANGYPAATISDFAGQTSPEHTFTAVAGDDGMEYTCQAGNSLGDPVTGAYTVMVAAIETPTITGDSTVTLGSSLTLTCNAVSNQAVSYVWLMDGVETQMTEATYTVNNVGFEKSGTYTCRASISVGEPKETSVDVTVNGIRAVSQNVVKSGEMATLSCAVESHPAPKFVWTRVGSDAGVDGTNVTKSGNTYTNTFMVGPLDQSFKEAEYRCDATNEAVPDQTVSQTLNFNDIEIPEEKSGQAATASVASSSEKPSATEIPEASSPPIAGIIIGILVALLVVAIILAVLYNKGIICKSDEKGEENAEDIAVDINNDEAAAGDVESGRKPEGGEEEKLMNGSDQ